MKIVIDVDRLLDEGRITTEEHARLKSWAVEDTGSLAFNILTGFGVVATAGGALALLPHGATAIILGLLLAAGGLMLVRKHTRGWGLLGSMLLVVGSVMCAGGILLVTQGGVAGFVVVTVLCLAAAVASGSALLAAMAVLALFGSTGAVAAYWHAMYMLAVPQPALTIALFSIVGLGTYRLSGTLPLDYQRLAIVAARTSLFLVNLGFWVGSLWGDALWLGQQAIPDWAFAIGWAVGLVVTGVWAARGNKRWVVNLLAVFAAIHFYTQYFEHLGASPATILLAGLVTLGIVLAVVRYNKQG
ncbi:hypothetical protein QWY84_17505 [Aquisalimonas lutea]|uniref:hypothetical protein n=1 Tax=Aquisalimonas lutea TaxID=1327750 RepID=UPI0025B29F26|nr:hypothetical protein [Aquisalimonas lutea]MDN3519406.1 hypothetical protein [Aquisalimonas lutea]